MIGRGLIILALAALLFGADDRSAAHAADPCPFTEDDVVGAWTSPVEDSDVVKGDAQEFAIERDGDTRLFREYLHHRPMGAGTWRFDPTSCVLSLDYGSLVVTLRLEGAGEPQLVGDNGEAYRKLTVRKA